MMFVWVTLVLRDRLSVEFISGFFCDEAGKASIDRVIARAIEKYRPIDVAVDEIMFRSDADFPPFKFSWVQ